MSVKYFDRLVLPKIGFSEINFFTKNKLKIAKGYKQVVDFKSKPFIEFEENQIDFENIFIPKEKNWICLNSKFSHVEFYSKDYCKIKILKDKETKLFYISPFNLTSDKFSVLIKTLLRKKTFNSLVANQFPLSKSINKIL